jgi:imidazolonepropionase-like amidohydrolase
MNQTRPRDRRPRWSVIALFMCAAASSIAGAPSASAQPAQPARPPAAPAAAAAAAAAAPAKPPAGQPAIAVVGATVHTGTGEIIEDGTVVIANGKVQQIGKGIAAPAGAEVIAARGLVVTPGLIDPLTQIGLVEISLEKSARDDHQAGDDAIRAGFRASDGYNPASAVIPVVRAEGLTSAGVIPTGGLISGQSLWADLEGATAEESIAQVPLALHVHLTAGAVGDGGHATAILRVREAFDDARTFQRTRAAWERNQSRPFAPSRLDLEALAGALGGKLPVVFHVDRAADILAALAVAKEHGLRPVIAGGAEAWKVAKAVAAAKAPVIILPLNADPESFDTIAARPESAALLHAAGVLVAISTGETHHARKLRQVAGNAVRAGLPYQAALAAITRAPAEALGMGARYGTLAAGKVANLVVWSGDPLELSTRARDVMIRGRRVLLRSRQTELLDRYRRFSR